MLTPPPTQSHILTGDCRALLPHIPSDSVHCVVTSPPYWGLRDYGTDPSIWGGDPNCAHDFKIEKWYSENSAAKAEGCAEAFSKAGEQNAARLKAARWREDGTCNICGAWRGSYGLEKTPQAYIEHTVEIFREVFRVLRPDGTCWLNLGDSYVAGGRGGGGKFAAERPGWADVPMEFGKKRGVPGLKHKDLVGIPWRVALALQADGWYLRQDIIWHKPNPMPESVRDRCTKAHEYLFMLTKSEKYYFDCNAIAEPTVCGRMRGPALHPDTVSTNGNGGLSRREDTGTRNRRSVWTISTKPYKEAHFATFPPDLVEPCIKAGSPVNGIVLDPFAGAGTTGVVAKKLQRHFLGMELNPEYVKLAITRISKTP